MLSIDLHAGQIQGFFNIPVDHLYAAPVILDYIRKELQNDLVIVSPDPGGVERARAFAKRVGVSLAIIDKRRVGPNVAQVMNVVGEVEEKNALLLDDMIDTAGTITQAALALKEKGANKVYACCTHPVFSGSAIECVQNSCLEEVVVTDTIPLRKEALLCKKIKTLSVSNLLGEAIRRIYNDDSVSELFV
jgi:ribose-phosphate pyrophosphokinase